MKDQEIMLFESRSQMNQAIGDKQVLLVKVNQQKYCVTRNGENAYLFEAKCPHYDHPLKEAKVNPMGEVVCPWHAYRFNLQSGDEAQNRCRKLRTYQAFEKPSGEIAVNIIQY